MMKIPLAITICLILTFAATGQTPSAIAAQSNQPARPTLKNFGSSLKKYEPPEKKSSPNNPIDKTEDADTIRVKTELVVNDVLVVNQKGNIISGLKKEDFIVTEDGAPQSVEMFAPGENSSVPRSIVLIVDRSGSLYPYLKNSFDAAKALIDKLGPNDRMAIVTDDVKLVVEFTKDKTLLKNAIEKMNRQFQNQRDGLSRQYSALLATLNEMFDDEDLRPIVIVQSDGDEITNLQPTANDLPMPNRIRAELLNLAGQREFNYQQLLQAVSSSRATIYSIIPGIRLLGYSEAEQAERIKFDYEVRRKYFRLGKPLFGVSELKERINNIKELYLARQNSMFQIAKLSGGYTDYIEKPEDAENVYSTIFTVIGNRYTLGYYPANQKLDGKRRRVQVEVRGHPEYIVTVRKFYLTQ